jgi:hypothetical protein
MIDVVLPKMGLLAENTNATLLRELPQKGGHAELVSPLPVTFQTFGSLHTIPAEYGSDITRLDPTMPEYRFARFTFPTGWAHLLPEQICHRFRHDCSFHDMREPRRD